MNKKIILFHLLFLILLGIFGNDFLKFKLGISNFPVIIYFIVCSMHMLLSFSFITNKLNHIRKVELYWMLFFIMYLLVLILSITGFYESLYLSGIYFNKSYIIPQSLFLLLLPIGISIYIAISQNYPYFQEVLEKYSNFIILLNIFLAFIGFARTTVTYYILILVVYIGIKKSNNYLFSLFLYFICLLYISLINSKTTCILMFIVFTIILIINTRIIDRIKKYFVPLLLITTMLILLINANINLIVEIIENSDPNSWWRITFWRVQLQTIKESNLIGVGLGSTYANSIIFTLLKGGFIDPETGLNTLRPETLFLTAQHNSYLNILYRTGLVGLLLFILSIKETFLGTITAYKDHFSSVLLLAFININIVIVFNVGLESPQFLIPFYLSSGSLLGFKNYFLDKNIMVQK